MPYGTGISGEKYEASFQIKVKPSSNQKDNVVSLLESVQFTGSDVFTGQSLVINKNSMNSDNLVDRPKEGTVQ